MSRLSETARSSSVAIAARSPRRISTSTSSPPESDAAISACATTSPCDCAPSLACTLSLMARAPWNARPCRRPMATSLPVVFTSSVGSLGVPPRRADRLTVPVLPGGKKPDRESRSSGSCVTARSAWTGRSSMPRRYDRSRSARARSKGICALSARAGSPPNWTEASNAVVPFSMRKPARASTCWIACVPRSCASRDTVARGVARVPVATMRASITPRARCCCSAGSFAVSASRARSSCASRASNWTGALDGCVAMAWIGSSP